MNDNMKDWGFILLCVGLVMLVSFLLSACSTTGCVKKTCCPEPGHGPCPICEYNS